MESTEDENFQIALIPTGEQSKRSSYREEEIEKKNKMRVEEEPGRKNESFPLKRRRSMSRVEKIDSKIKRNYINSLV